MRHGRASLRQRPAARLSVAMAIPMTMVMAVLAAPKASAQALSTPMSFDSPRMSDQDLDRVLQSLAARRHGEVDFVEQHFLSLLKRPTESSGELIYDAPARLEKHTLEPRPERLLADGNVLTVERGGHKHVLDLDAYPQLRPFIEGIRATLAGDRAALERTFKLEFTGDEALWTLVLTPRTPQLAGTVATIRIDGAHDDLRKVEVRQADGDRSVTTLRARPKR